MALPAQIDFTNWTLFVDRDGVINKKIEGDYVSSWQYFTFLPGVLQALKSASTLFKYIVVVTNQQGIGKGKMTVSDLQTLHNQMMTEVNAAGGRIDAIYFAPQLQSENSFMRKPNPGMVLQAKEDIPSIDLSKSLMIGDSIIDMEMGRRAGIYTVFIKDKPQNNNPLIDAVFPSLLEAIHHLKSIKI